MDFDPSVTPLDTIVKTIEASGYEVPLVDALLPIEGMHCASCVARVEAKLAAVEGVRSAAVNLATGQAAVRYVPGVVETQMLADAVAAAGDYRVVQPAAGETPEDLIDKLRAEDAKWLQRRFVVGVVFSVPLLWDMAGHLLGTGSPFHGTLRPYGLLAFTLPVYLFSGWPFHLGAWRALKARTADMNTLVSLGTTTAFSIRWRPPWLRAPSATRARPAIIITTPRRLSSHSFCSAGGWKRGPRAAPAPRSRRSRDFSRAARW
ncbi:MAG: cation transporter [Deltaproteobacteria bacterium]|nr:cation transporter [Deltaproteobacteria bacterium]